MNPAITDRCHSYLDILWNLTVARNLWITDANIFLHESPCSVCVLQDNLQDHIQFFCSFSFGLSCFVCVTWNSGSFWLHTYVHHKWNKSKSKSISVVRLADWWRVVFPHIANILLCWYFALASIPSHKSSVMTQTFSAPFLERHNNGRYHGVGLFPIDQWRLARSVCDDCSCSCVCLLLWGIMDATNIFLGWVGLWWFVRIVMYVFTLALDYSRIYSGWVGQWWDVWNCDVCFYPCACIHLNSISGVGGGGGGDIYCALPPCAGAQP